MSKIDYKVVCIDISSYTLYNEISRIVEQKVNEFIVKGYTPIGGLSLTMDKREDIIVMQAMTKEFTV